MNKQFRSFRNGSTAVFLTAISTVMPATSALSAVTDASALPDANGFLTGGMVASFLLFALIAFLVLKRRQNASSPLNAAQSVVKSDRAGLDQIKDFAANAKQAAEPASAPEKKDPAPASANAVDYEALGGDIVAMQRAVIECRRAVNAAERQDALTNICAALAEFKKNLSPPALRPAWELAVAVEGLLKQLTFRDTNNTPSTLRTLESAVALLADLCEPGVRPDLLENPPIKILAADDDEVCRFALVAALKKTFDAPEVVADGEAAVALAKQTRFDLILLDVMMPRMDGFEVCARIREVLTNRATPIVFITALKDFETRSSLIVRGGNEVIGKPMLASEVTVKVLSLILRSRLHRGNSTLHIQRDEDQHSNHAVQWPEINRKPAAPATPGEAPVYLPDKETADSQTLLPPPVFDLKNPTQVSEEFLKYIEAFVAEMKKQVGKLPLADGIALRMELGVRLHLRFQCLSRAMDVPCLHPAFSVCRSVEGLIKKFSENPKHISETSVRTVIEALDLLNNLCKPGVKPDLAKEPPIRLLVVDDEPIARRALCGALQMGFSKPFEAETGEAALEMANTKKYDLIFMDVCMPGMDGFAACERILKTAQNSTTPVVFVTSLSDDEFRQRAAQSGGADYIIKPFIFMEINLKALTMILRGRLEKSKPSPARATPEAVTASN